MSNGLFWYCVIFSACGGPARGTRSIVIVLYFTLCGMLSVYLVFYFPCVEGSRVERALALLCYILLCGGPASGTRSSVVV